jgi:hypothetical protein
LPLTARFASFTVAFDLALLFVPDQVAYDFLGLAFDSTPCMPPLAYDTPLSLLT